MRGYLLKTVGPDKFIFRIYQDAKQGLFKDYKIQHNDLEIDIIDDDFMLYETPVDGYDGFIDYPAHVLKNQQTVDTLEKKNEL